jgi:hypothetical protein
MMSNELLPMDRVRVKATGEELMVNSAHYTCFQTGTRRQMFSICRFVPKGETPPLFYADECELVHRHDYKPYKGVRRCDCGQVYTTMADYMAPRGDVTWQ